MIRKPPQTQNFGYCRRKIHKKKALTLYKHLTPTIKRVFGSATRGIFVRITLPDRLNSTPQQLAGIESAVSRGVLSGRGVTQNADCEVEVFDFPISESPFNVGQAEEISWNSVTEFTRANWQRSNPNMMILFSPGKRAVVVLPESAQADKVLHGIFRQLRESSKGQFTKIRPGYLFVQFTDLTEAQLRSLAEREGASRSTATGLQVMTSELLQSPNRAHIHTVAYRSHGNLERPADQAQAVLQRGIGYVIKNPLHALYGDPRYDLLEASPNPLIIIPS
jgi:hypothetical protein